MLQILGKILHRIYLGGHFLHHLLLVPQQFIERRPAETVASSQIQVFPKGKSPQVIAFDDILQLGVLLLQPHHATAGKDYSQPGIHIIAKAQLPAPVRLLEHLVDEQHSPTLSVELSGKVTYTLPLEIEVVHVHVETSSVIGTELLFSILQQESRLPHSARTFYSYHTCTPIHLVHQDTAHGSIAVLHQI